MSFQFSKRTNALFSIGVLLMSISVTVKGNDPIDRSTANTMNCPRVLLMNFVNGLCSFRLIQYIRLALSHLSSCLISFFIFSHPNLYLSQTFHHGKPSFHHGLLSSHKESKEAHQASRNVQLSKRTKHTRGIQFDQTKPLGDCLLQLGGPQIQRRRIDGSCCGSHQRPRRYHFVRTGPSRCQMVSIPTCPRILESYRYFSCRRRQGRCTMAPE